MNGVAKQQQHHHHHDDHQEDIVPLHRTTDLVLALNTPKGGCRVAMSNTLLVSFSSKAPSFRRLCQYTLG